MATLPTEGNLRLPEGVRERTDLFANHRFIDKKPWGALVVLMRSSKRFGVRRREGILSFDACRFAMFRWSKCQNKREVEPGSLKTKVEIHGCSLKAFSLTKQRRWSSHVLSVHPGGAKSMNSLLLRKALVSRKRHGRVMSDVARCTAAWRRVWDEPKERTRRRKWDGPVVAW